MIESRVLDLSLLCSPSSPRHDAARCVSLLHVAITVVARLLPSCGHSSLIKPWGRQRSSFLLSRSQVASESLLVLCSSPHLTVYALQAVHQLCQYSLFVTSKPFPRRFHILTVNRDGKQSIPLRLYQTGCSLSQVALSGTPCWATNISFTVLNWSEFKLERPL